LNLEEGFLLNFILPFSFIDSVLESFNVVFGRLFVNFKSLNFLFTLVNFSLLHLVFFLLLCYLMHLRRHLKVFGLDLIFKLSDLVGSDLKLSLELSHFVLSL